MTTESIENLTNLIGTLVQSLNTQATAAAERETAAATRHTELLAAMGMIGGQGGAQPRQPANPRRENRRRVDLVDGEVENDEEVEARAVPPMERPKIRADIPFFSGELNTEEFIDWLSEVEKYFDLMEIDDDRKVPYVAYKLRSGASAWWNQLVRHRSRNNWPPIRRWRDMKSALKERFLPDDFDQEIYRKFLDCKQGNRTVEEYARDFHSQSARTDLNETESLQVARFTNGLSVNIRNQVELFATHSVSEAITRAKKVERQITAASGSSVSSSSVGTPFVAKEATVISEPVPNQVGPVRKAPVPTPATGTQPAANPYARPRGTKCFKCGQEGHISSSCPQRKNVNLVNHGDADDDEVEEEYWEDPNTDETHGAFVVRKLMLTTPATEEPPERHGIFRTLGNVNEQQVKIIVDSGSCDNLIARGTVNKLKLEVQKHPTPYTVGWINASGQIKVTEQCIVPFSIGRYKDVVVCDVIDMSACQLLLGRPWHFDVDSTHNGRDNVISFVKDGIKFHLCSLRDKEVQNRTISLCFPRSTVHCGTKKGDQVSGAQVGKMARARFLPDVGTDSGSSPFEVGENDAAQRARLTRKRGGRTQQGGRPPGIGKAGGRKFLD